MLKSIDQMKKIIFLHHSTGWNIWIGKTNKYVHKITGKGDVQKYFRAYNFKNRTDYQISERFYPKEFPYGWNNYPFDYYNIWVKHAGDLPFLKEDALEILTKQFDVIVFKHCYPVSKILPDTGIPDINSFHKRLENYKLQYSALKTKMHEFPNTKFIVWTTPVHVKDLISTDEAIRTQEFYHWVINDWDEKGDNIYVWDFYKYETEGELFLPERNAYSKTNSHPNKAFSAMVAPKFCKFIIDVIEGKIE